MSVMNKYTNRYTPEFELIEGWSNIDHLADEIIARAKRVTANRWYDTSSEAIRVGEKALAIAESDYHRSTPRIKISAKEHPLIKINTRERSLARK